jgi:hypothetical protein
MSTLTRVARTPRSRLELIRRKVPAKLQTLVQKIVNIVEALDDDGLSKTDRGVLVENCLSLGKELRAKWSLYQKANRERRIVDGKDDGNDDDERGIRNSDSRLASVAAARQDRTNVLLERQNVLLTELVALLQQRDTRLDEMSNSIRQLTDDHKDSKTVLSKFPLNADGLQGTVNPMFSANS